MSPAEYGRWLASQAPVLTDEQVEQAARLLATMQPEEMAA